MKPTKNKKVLVLFCGGTIVMEKARGGVLRVPPKAKAIKMLERIEPRLGALSDFKIEFVENIDSTNMSPDKWDKILGKIESNYDDYDGFLITHGTDTMAYTAAALSIAIKNLGKPIVLTGSQIPGSRIDTDARRNLVNAMRVAIMDISGVFIVFDERVILGSRASKASESRLDAFTSVNAPDAGEIKTEIRLSQGIPGRRADRAAFFPGFEPDIVVHTLTPGCDPKDLIFLLQNQRIKGIIIRAYGTGNLPYDFDLFFRRARMRRIPVVVTSQCLHGMTMMKGYDVGEKALKLGAIEGFDQSLEILAVKLMWSLKHFCYPDIGKVIQTNSSAELTS
jgi:L-asparaginase